jgi:hypothetical protein
VESASQLEENEGRMSNKYASDADSFNGIDGNLEKWKTQSLLK